MSLIRARKPPTPLITRLGRAWLDGYTYFTTENDYCQKSQERTRPVT